jgi:hypothetical protein
LISYKKSIFSKKIADFDFSTNFVLEIFSNNNNTTTNYNNKNTQQQQQQHQEEEKPQHYSVGILKEGTGGPRYSRTFYL